MKKSTQTKLAGVLIAFCAVVWTLRVVLDIITQTYNDSMLLFVLHIICAVAWIIATTANIARAVSRKEK